ncbi:MAG TPA: DNA-binding protein, partial [Bryobacteraceae bacterium]
VRAMLEMGENPTYDRIRKQLGPDVSGNMKLIKGLIKEARERWALTGRGVNWQFSGEKARPQKSSRI